MLCADAPRGWDTPPLPGVCGGHDQTPNFNANVNARDAILALHGLAVSKKQRSKPTATKTKPMNIGQAIEALKQGKWIQRAGWHGKNMHVYMEEGSTWAKGTGSQRYYEPYLVLFTPKKTHQPGWNASTPDLLADDWEVIQPH